jgi:hypothetical protein
MGGCGTCVKKSIKLKSSPQGIPRQLLEEMRSYIDQQVMVLDRTGMKTYGKCIEVWSDEDASQEMLEHGNIAVENFSGISFIGLNIVESVELVEQPPTHQ